MNAVATLTVRLCATVGILCLWACCAILFALSLADALDGDWWMPVATAPWWLTGFVMGGVVLYEVWAEPL